MRMKLQNPSIGEKVSFRIFHDYLLEDVLLNQPALANFLIETFGSKQIQLYDKEHFRTPQESKTCLFKNLVFSDLILELSLFNGTPGHKWINTVGGAHQRAVSTLLKEK